MALERKTHPWAECELKLKGSEGIFEGIASTWNNVDSYGDTILQGAYAESLKLRMPAFFFNHRPHREDMTAKIGRFQVVRETDAGLHVVAKLTLGHPIVKNILPSLEAGDLDGLSIGYTVPEGGAVLVEKGDSYIRQLSQIDLYEISLVERPADSFARVDLASVKSIKTVRDAEDTLRDAGFSNDGAKAFLSQVKEILRNPSAEALAKAEAAKQDLREAVLLQHLRVAFNLN